MDTPTILKSAQEAVKFVKENPPVPIGEAIVVGAVALRDARRVADGLCRRTRHGSQVLNYHRLHRAAAIWDVLETGAAEVSGLCTRVPGEDIDHDVLLGVRICGYQLWRLSDGDGDGDGTFDILRSLGNRMLDIATKASRRQFTFEQVAPVAHGIYWDMKAAGDLQVTFPTHYLMSFPSIADEGALAKPAVLMSATEVTAFLDEQALDGERSMFIGSVGVDESLKLLVLLMECRDSVTNLSQIDSLDDLSSHLIAAEARIDDLIGAIDSSEYIDRAFHAAELRTQGLQMIETADKQPLLDSVAPLGERLLKTGYQVLRRSRHPARLRAALSHLRSDIARARALRFVF
ncbi:hypothetical protein ACP4OV_022150 [Aristida adscensionis]